MKGSTALRLTPVALLLATLALPVAWADDWPQWGGTLERNMFSPETGLPSSFDIEGKTVNVRWVARLGSQTYGTPTIAGGKVYIGTNNGAPRNPSRSGDRLVLMCLNEDTGGFNWQFASPRRRNYGHFNGDYGGLGVCSSAAVDGDRVYVVTNRCHVVCLDINALGSNRNPAYSEEAQYLAEPGYEAITPGPNGPRLSLSPGRPVQLAANDAQMIWVCDMMKEAGSWPHDATNSCPLVYGDYVYTGTGNGQADNHRYIPSPKGATVIALDKRTGKLVARDNAGIAPGVFGGGWSSPSLGMVNDRPLLFYGGGDGFCYAFDPRPEPGVNGKPGLLRCVWRFDGNPPEYRRCGYYDTSGPSDIIGTPVFDNNRVYVAVGQDPRHGPGKGCLSCIDATKTGNISATGAIWRYKGIGRTCSTVSVADGLVYAADYGGTLHCVDAATGKAVWTQALGSKVWGSTLCADGKVYLGTENGYLWVMKAGRTRQVLDKIPMHAPIYTTPVVANGVLYVATHRFLYALRKETPPATTATTTATPAATTP